ncbi:hypothetical protein [Amycolatopsis sp. H20-H5]|uniref:hypothetical protein n=1 Tax=Amycolatopsis sp. H20-H5 TaxID=3046309 RepID=UPI002DB9AB3A|nr:hypothetical protein [Amycolatopsis sp. H20-H5]MEC3976998.1 hypothetical protein [Amycolatopsis sp. H20-H5]
MSTLDWRIAAHSEVISPLGAALALVRESVERIVPNPSHAEVLAVRAEAEAAVVAQGAATAGVEVDVTVDPQRNLVRAVATGSTELRTKDRSAKADSALMTAEVARSLGVSPADVAELARTGHHHVLGARIRGRGLSRWKPPRLSLRVIDDEGVLRLHSADAYLRVVTAGEAVAALSGAVGEHTSFGDGGSRAPAVRLLVGPKIADLSGVLDPDQLIALIRTEVGTRPKSEPVVAILETR